MQIELVVKEGGDRSGGGEAVADELASVKSPHRRCDRGTTDLLVISQLIHFPKHACVASLILFPSHLATHDFIFSVINPTSLESHQTNYLIGKLRNLV